MATPAPHLPLSLPDYLHFEASADTRHAFHDGEAYAMAGGSPAHAVLALNAGAVLKHALAGSPCTATSPDLRIYIDAANLTYADAAVLCPPVEHPADDPLAVSNPSVLVEVLSPSTAAWDRGGKFALYRRITSLRHYLIVAQDCWQVEHYRRMDDGSWRLTVHGPGQVVALDTLNVEIRVDDVYAKVEVVGGPTRDSTPPARPKERIPGQE